MRKKGLIIMSTLIVLFTLQSCSSNPEEGLLKRYFNAVSMNDNATMSSIALEPMTLDVSSFDVVSVSPEKIEPASLPALNKKEAELKKKLEEHVGPTIDAKDVLDSAIAEIDLARTKASKQAAQKKVDELQAKYDQEFALHKELQKQYNEAKSASSREEEMTAFSLGDRNRSIANIRELTGDVHSKDVEIKVKIKSGETKNFKLTMKKYSLKDDVVNFKHNSRWIIISFEPLG